MTPILMDTVGQMRVVTAQPRDGRYTVITERTTGEFVSLIDFGDPLAAANYHMQCVDQARRT